MLLTFYLGNGPESHRANAPARLIFIYPLGTVLLGMLQVNRMQRLLRAERKLQESERFARSTMDALGAHIAGWMKTGTILAVNKAWEDFALANPPVLPL
jgi:PAS domain-containing protein